MDLSALICTMDLDFFGTGKHKINFEDMMEMYRNDTVYILDVRTKDECDYIQFPFAQNIPLHELPEQLGPIPKDKTIAVFCSSETRAVIAYTFLLTKGYDAKIVLEKLGELAEHFKPGYVRKNLI